MYMFGRLGNILSNHSWVLTINYVSNLQIWFLTFWNQIKFFFPISKLCILLLNVTIISISLMSLLTLLIQSDPRTKTFSKRHPPIVKSSMSTALAVASVVNSNMPTASNIAASTGSHTFDHLKLHYYREFIIIIDA